jgi:hypothetical protein
MAPLISLISEVGKTVWEQRLRIAAVARVLATRTSALITTLILALVGSIFLALFVQRSQRYEAVVGKVLNDGTASQDQPALEALLLSSIEANIVPDLKNEKLDSSFEETWNQLVLSAEQPPHASTGFKLMVDSPGSETLTEYYDPSPSQNSPKERRTPGFLFAPYFLLIPPLDKVSQDQVLFHQVPLFVTPKDTAPQNDSIQLTAEGIYTQVALSRSIAESMQRLAGNPMVSSTSHVSHLLAAVPVQSYVVMSGGITRVFIHDDPNPTTFFGSQFPATTFFPSRPYFWPTFNDHPSFYTHLSVACDSTTAGTIGTASRCTAPLTRPSDTSIFSNAVASDTTIGQFFRVSSPYLDLGGSGVVITLTRGIVIDGVAKAVVCIDLRFDDNNGVLKALNNTIKSLNGEVFSLECDVSKASQHLICANEATMPPRENDLFYEVKNEFLRSPTQVLSNLYRFDAGSSVRFSLPLDRTINNDGSQRLTLVLASFDPSSYKTHTSIIGFIAASAFGLLTAFIAYLWGSLEVGWRRYAQAFERVDEVMNACPTPYTRLDTTDAIIAANPAFAGLLRCPVTDLIGTTLRSKCFDEGSLATYDKVEALRKEHGQVLPYELTLRDSQGMPVKVTVHSAAIPSEIRDALPGTFGIMISH